MEADSGKRPDKADGVKKEFSAAWVSCDDLYR